MTKIKLRRAGGYDPALGRLVRDPTLEYGLIRSHVRDHIATMNQLTESVRSELKRGGMIWRGGQRGDPPNSEEIRAMRASIKRLRRAVERGG
jgi:hypothetical protein